MNFKEWLISEGSRWRQDNNLWKIYNRSGGTQKTMTRGSLLDKSSQALGKESMPGLNKKYNSLPWYNADAETENAFANDEYSDAIQQPPYLYRGHNSEDPYQTRIGAYAKPKKNVAQGVPASPWASLSAKYGTNTGTNTISGSRFKPADSQQYYKDFGMERDQQPSQPYQIHGNKSPSNTVGHGITAGAAYETPINQATHGSGSPVLMKPGGMVAPISNDLYKQTVAPNKRILNNPYVK